jgi:hypothetical protein
VSERVKDEKEGRGGGDDAPWQGYRKKLDRAVTYFMSDEGGANKRVVEAYVNTRRDTSGGMALNLMDYTYFAVAGYDDISPTTSYAKFLCTFAKMVEIFFIVVFFNALLSLKGAREHVG